MYISEHIQGMKYIQLASMHPVRTSNFTLPSGTTTGSIKGKIAVFVPPGVDRNDFMDPNLLLAKKNGDGRTRYDKNVRTVELYIAAFRHLGHAPKRSSNNLVEKAAYKIGVRLKRMALPPELVRLLKTRALTN